MGPNPSKVEFDRPCSGLSLPVVTVRQIVDEIAALPLPERAQVCEFVRQLEAGRELSGAELATLASRLAASTDDPNRAKLLREEIVRGFYGGAPHA
jgi:hypothetical protein